MQEMQVQSLGQEDPLEKEMATHCSILAWRTPWTEEPSGLHCMGSSRVRHDLATEHLFVGCAKRKLGPTVVHRPLQGHAWALFLHEVSDFPALNG